MDSQNLITEFKFFRSVLNEKQKRRALSILAVFGGFIIQISLGGVYTYGSMFPYIIQYMVNNTHENEQKGNTVWIIGLAIFGRGASMTLGGYLENKLSATFTILLGGSIMSFGYLLTFWTIKIHMALVSMSYGLIVGIGTGVAYGVSMAVPSEWFPNNRGLLAGIVLAGFGIGSLGFDLIQAFYINRDISNFDLVNSSNVPFSFILMGCTYFLIQLIGVPMIRRPPRKKEENISQRDFVVFNLVQVPTEVNIRPHQLIFISQFWILWLTYALNSVISVFFLFLQKMWGEFLNFSDFKLLIATTVGGIFSIIGRIIWGFLIDKYTYKVLMAFLTLGSAFMIGTFYICSYVGSLEIEDENGRYVMYLLWVIILYFLGSGNFSLFPAVCVKRFGSRHYIENFGVLFTGYSFSGILTSVLLARFFQKPERVHDFLSTFMTGAGISVLSFCISLLDHSSINITSINGIF